MLDCPHFNAQCSWLRGKLGDKAKELTSLFADPKYTKHTLNYIHATRRLESTFGDLTPPKNKDHA